MHLSPKPVICVLATLFLISCQNPSASSPEKQKEQKNNSQPDTYIKEYFDKQGNLYSRVTMKDSVPNGPATTYYKDGTINTVANNLNGKKHGIETKYYGTGEPYRERPYNMGIRDGWEKRYYKNGQIMSEVYYHNNMLSNQIKEYDQEGDLKSKYPEIRFRMIRDRDYAGQRLLILTLSNESTSVVFYQGQLLEGKYLPEGLTQLGGKKGSAEIGLDGIPSGTTIPVIAKYITYRNTPCILTGSWTASD